MANYHIFLCCSFSPCVPSVVVCHISRFGGSVTISQGLVLSPAPLLLGAKAPFLVVSWGLGYSLLLFHCNSEDRVFWGSSLVSFKLVPPNRVAKKSSGQNQFQCSPYFPGLLLSIGFWFIILYSLVSFYFV